MSDYLITAGYGAGIAVVLVLALNSLRLIRNGTGSVGAAIWRGLDQRIKELEAENKVLKGKVSELERELATQAARHDRQMVRLIMRLSDPKLYDTQSLNIAPLPALLDMATRHFSLSEFKTVLANAGVDYEALPGDTIGDLAREALLYGRRTGTLAAMVGAMHDARPRAGFGQHLE